MQAHRTEQPAVSTDDKDFLSIVFLAANPAARIRSWGRHHALASSKSLSM